MRPRRRTTPRALRALCVALAAAPLAGCAAAPADVLRPADGERLRVGVGDRLALWRDGSSVALADEARELGMVLDFFQIWLPRGWERSWIETASLERLTTVGITPVVVHYYFGDEISRERFLAHRDPWYASVWELAQAVRMDAPVLVVLEPEWNNAPPRGETAMTDWPDFADHLRAAARMIRAEAPNALVGVCAGDFSPDRNLEPVLASVASDLDFLAFQEMRATTDREAGRPGYFDVGGAALEYARYLQRAFGRPLLLAYVAVSSYAPGPGSFEAGQTRALRSLVARRRALREAGVFGAIYFQLRDDPEHRGYFGPAEAHFGLVREDGTAKPALEAFRALSE